MQSVNKELTDFYDLQVQELVGKVVEKGPNYVADPSGLRTGNPPDENMAQVLQEVALKLEEYVSKVSVDVKLFPDNSKPIVDC
jgi:hypothetical protein